MRPELEATGPIPWVITQFSRFLRDGYQEIRALISSSTPHSVKRAFTGSLAALILALLAVAVIAWQIHPAAVILAVVCVLMIVYGRSLFHRLALFAGYFLCGFVLFIGAGLITVVPLEKEYPTLAKIIAVFLFVVLCLVIPALLSLRPRKAVIGHSAAEPANGGEMRKPAVTFADVGGLEEAKKQIRGWSRRTSTASDLGSTGCIGTASCSMARGALARRPWLRRSPGVRAEVPVGLRRSSA